MKLKQRPGDFRVRELLRPDAVGGAGDHRVYRVTKRKLTSLEAAAALAREAGVAPGRVAMVGMKDRQGITVQHMSVEKGRELDLRGPELRIETVGFAREELSGEAGLGNAFEITLRALDARERRALRRNLVQVREHGLINYFAEQRFGNLRHGQGWIALQLLRGEHEAALRTLLTAPSPQDDAPTRAFKDALGRRWGDWDACRAAAGRHGGHHSLFEHLKRHPQAFAEAFRYVASRLRLIHLYAYQSHLWNRAVAELVRERTTPARRVVLRSLEGPLAHPVGPFEAAAEMGGTFRLPGPGLEDVTHPVQRALLADVLARDHLVPDAFRIENVPGFQLKGEDRELVLHPAHLRVRPAEPDPLNAGLQLVRLRFELPRGAYATLVVERLVAGAYREEERPARRGSERRRGPAGPDERRRAGRPDRDGRARGRPPRGGRPRRTPKDEERA